MGKNKIDKLCNSSLWVGGNDWVKDFCENKNESCTQDCNDKDKKDQDFNKIKDKIRQYLKNYLQLDNVSFLFGTGSSLLLGAKSIRSFPLEIESEINKENVINELFYLIVKQIQNNFNKLNKEEIEIKENIMRWKNNKEIIIPLEEYLNYLLAINFILEMTGEFEIKKNKIQKINLDKLIKTIKTELFKLCDIDKINNDQNKYIYHKKFLKALLTRPLNLKRANLFTTNYDLVFENSFDELGIQYIDGFSGFHQRTFKPEIFDYDIYYPGSTTEGKVRRIERLLKYYKLHGSLTWIKESSASNNIYGLSEKSIEYIRKCISDNKDSTIGNLIIYPTSNKKEYTLNFPYSELFRQFAQAITQPQSVLFCIGYSFFDEHINDIIYQALSIPSFTLIVVDYNGTKNIHIKRLKEINDPRIIIFEGEYLGDFKIFSDELIPYLNELDLREKVAETINKLYPEKSKEKNHE